MSQSAPQKMLHQRRRRLLAPPLPVLAGLRHRWSDTVIPTFAYRTMKVDDDEGFRFDGRNDGPWAGIGSRF